MKPSRSTFRPGQLWPDNNGVHINAHGGGILCHEGVYYWFGEHKIAGEAGNVAHVGVHVYSSRDLYNWDDRGIALAVSKEPSSDITSGCVIERPRVVYNRKTGRFAMWFHLELIGKGYDAARCGVAVSDSPEGPYRYVESFRLCPGVWPLNAGEADKAPDTKLARDFEGGQMSRDMTVYADDDGKAYQFSASEDNETLHIYLLSEDYLRPSDTYVRGLPGRSNEAPAVFKNRGRYFMISSDCTGWNPNAARLAVAESILGEWTEYPNPCVGTPEQVAFTFESQSTYVLPVDGKPDAFIFMADRWRPDDAIDGRYVWLPIWFENGLACIYWLDKWDLSAFD